MGELRKRNWHGPSRCAMCYSDEETNFHMFFQCQYVLQIWQVLANLFGFPLIAFISTQAVVELWSAQKESWRPLIIIVLWCAWKWWNNRIFKESKFPLMSILQHIISVYDYIPKNPPKMKKGHSTEDICFRLETPRAFFNGAEQQKICGCGVHIIMDKNMQYFISWSGGRGSNSLAEVQALAGLLAFCTFFDIQSISIFGDSKSVINHVMGSSHIRCPHLADWLDRIMF